MLFSPLMLFVVGLFFLASRRLLFLRLHMKSLGHPIVGDAAYAEDWHSYRMFLHARALSLPMKSKNLQLQTEEPFCDDGLFTPE